MSEPPPAELRTRVMLAMIENSTMAVFFHTAIAEQVGLGATDEKTLFLLRGAGPLTAGEIAQRTQLTTASVTNLIDRLERKGFVRRVRDTADRRRVFVEVVPESLAELDRIFGGLAASLETLTAGFDADQLTAILAFLERATSSSRDVLDSLRRPPP